MTKVTERHIKEIAKAVAEEFPDDPALQQVHVARKILAKEAELQGSGFLEHIKSLRSQHTRAK